MSMYKQLQLQKVEQATDEERRAMIMGYTRHHAGNLGYINQEIYGVTPGRVQVLVSCVGGYAWINMNAEDIFLGPKEIEIGRKHFDQIKAIKNCN